MAGFRVEMFRGMRPRISSLKLTIGESSNAENCDLGSGDAEPFLDKATEQAVTAGRSAKTIYLFDNIGSPIWFEWDDYVDVARGPVKDDSLERTYYTGDSFGSGAPKMTNTDLVGSTGPYPEDWVYMGVPAPENALTVVTPGLAENVAASDRFVAHRSIKSRYIDIDIVEYTTYAASAGDEWTLNAGAMGEILFPADVGTSFRVLSVVNSNKVSLESISEEGIFARTANSDRTTVNDYAPFDSDDTAAVADFMGWRLPSGVVVTIVGHNLIIGDVITISAVGIPITWGTFVGDSIWGDGNWPVVVPNYETGSAVNQHGDCRIQWDINAIGSFTMSGSFFYDVDRTASAVSELEDRQYVYTYVTDLGEEGPPSDVSAVYEVLDTATVTINDLAPPPTIGYNITKIRLYRTNSTEAGTEYQFVKEFDAVTTTTDSVASQDLGEVIGTTTWTPPPANMSGLTEMPNGMLVGFYGKNLYFCEPYFPHAWPAEYDQAIGHEIVGLASFGNSLAVMTKGHPYVVTGSHPRNMNIRPIKFNQACVSKESIASEGDRVYYASPDGLVEISANGVRLATEAFLTKEDWAAYEPSEMRSSFYEGRYYGFHGFDISAIPLVVSAEFSGTIATALEEDIVNGAKTIILTLTNDTWLTAGAAFEAQRQNIINGLTAATSQTLGWNNELRDSALLVAHVVRTSDTVVTITLPVAPSYSVTADEVITCNIPATALTDSSGAIVCGSTFTITAQTAAATVTIGGTANTATEANIVSGGKTITLTLTNDTWLAAGTSSFDAERQGIIDGLAATTDEADGFNDTVPQELSLTDVVRTSDTLVTITLPAIADYDTDDDESITAVVPATALTTSIVQSAAVNTIAILAQAGNPSAIITGTVDGATEAEIVAGGKTIIITLTNDTYVAAGTGPIGSTADSQAFIDAIIATTSQTLGWNNVVQVGIDLPADLVRTSSTVCTITLDAEATYSVATNETIGIDVPAEILVTSAGDLTASNTVAITAQAPVTCALTGTITGTPQEDEIEDGGLTIILTLSNDTWEAAGTGPIGSTADTQAIIDGITSAQSEGTGWNAQVRDIDLAPSDVTRTSDTICTILLPASGSYDITAQETITATVPAAAMVISSSTVVAAPTFTVDVDVPAAAAGTGTLDDTNTWADDVRQGGKTLILTVSDDTWVDSGATFNAQRQAIIDGLDAPTSPAGHWNLTVRDLLVVGDVIRTSNTVVTITLSAQATYLPTADEVVTVTVPAAALSQSGIAVTGTPTITMPKDTQGINMMRTMPWGSGDNTHKVQVSSGSAIDWTDYEVDSETLTNGDADFGAILYGSATWAIHVTDPASYKNSIYVSTDDGVNWTKKLDASTDSSQPGSGTIYHADTTTMIFFASSNVHYSTDDGVNWVEGGAITTYGDSSLLYYGGSLYVVTRLSGLTYGRSANLSTGDPDDTWTSNALTFDGVIVVGDVDNSGTASGNGKNVFFITDTSGHTYISTVPHNSTTETYVGKISSTNFGPGTWPADYGVMSAFGGGVWCLYADGQTLTCDSGDEGTIGNWTNNGEVIDETTLNCAIRGIYYDDGSVSGNGLGFVAYGFSIFPEENGQVIFTSPDGVTWTERARGNTIFDSEPYFWYPNQMATNSPPSLA